MNKPSKEDVEKEEKHHVNQKEEINLKIETRTHKYHSNQAWIDEIFDLFLNWKIDEKTFKRNLQSVDDDT